MVYLSFESPAAHAAVQAAATLVAAQYPKAHPQGISDPQLLAKETIAMAQLLMNEWEKIEGPRG